MRAARRAELAGESERAVELWVDAGQPEHAARVLLLRSDADLDPQGRLMLLGRAIELAPEHSAIRATARKKRAQLFLELAKTGALAAGLRHELRHAAEELVALGEPVASAEAFRLLGDEEGRARALVAAGDVEELEYVLHQDVSQERASRDLRDGVARAAELIVSGERRTALHHLEGLVKAFPTDAALRERLAWLRASRLMAPLVRVASDGHSELMVLGAEVHIGRTEGEILVSHSALSRRHLRLFRDGAGAPHVEDLASRNGTTLRGVRLGGPLRVVGATSLMLGGEVPCTITSLPPRAESMAPLRLEIAGATYVAALGPTRVGGDLDWELASDADGWIALHAGSPAFFGEIALGRTTELLAGDVLASERNGPAIVRVER